MRSPAERPSPARPSALSPRHPTRSGWGVSPVRVTPGLSPAQSRRAHSRARSRILVGVIVKDGSPQQISIWLSAYARPASTARLPGIVRLRGPRSENFVPWSPGRCSPRMISRPDRRGTGSRERFEGRRSVTSPPSARNVRPGHFPARGVDTCSRRLNAVGGRPPIVFRTGAPLSADEERCRWIAIC
jgi:hypothetical protein